jgi:hypothetical protein
MYAEKIKMLIILKDTKLRMHGQDSCIRLKKTATIGKARDQSTKR